MEYNGGRKENDIVDWVLRKVGPATSPATCDSLKETIAKEKLVVAYFGDVNAKEFKETFEKLANDAEVGEKYKYFTSDDKDCAAAWGADSLPAMVLHRKFDESPLVSNNFAFDAAKQWLKSSSVPILIEFSEDYIEPIFGERKAAIFLFRSDSDKDAEFQKVFAEAATKYNGQLIFAYSDVASGIQSRLGEFVGVTSNMLPCIRILDPAKDMAKYAFEGELNGLTVD